MRHVPVAHEHVADIDTFAQHLVKPGCLGVIGVVQIIGAHIGHMAAVHADNAQIHKGAAVVLHDAENLAQPGGIAQFGIGVSEGQGFDLGHPLHNEGVQGAVLAAGHGLQARADFLVVDIVDAVQAEHTQSRQRRKRQQEQGQQQAAVDGSVAPQRGGRRQRHGGAS